MFVCSSFLVLPCSSFFPILISPSTSPYPPPVTPSEIREQIDVLTVQAKQKGEEPPDEGRAKEEIENSLLRRKVFDLLAAHADITWVEPALDAPQAQA
jgi:hypothetical protein